VGPRTLQREYELALLAYQGELAEYEALTEEQRAAAERQKPPEKPVLSSSFIQPVERFWKLLKDLYPERSTARIQEFWEFQMKPAESMANMVSRLQTLRLEACSKATRTYFGVQVFGCHSA
jgi:hypothetical protein